MEGFRFRLIDTDGSEIGIVTHSAPEVSEGDTVPMPDGRPILVLDVYDDEFGQEGGVRATLVVNEGSEATSDAPAQEVVDLEVASDYGQIYIYDPAAVPPETGDVEESAFLAALEDASSSGRFVGSHAGLIDVLTPSQWNWKAPLRLELDLPVPSGTLRFEASGGGPATETHVRPGRYRARLSGRNSALMSWRGRRPTPCSSGVRPRRSPP